MNNELILDTIPAKVKTIVESGGTVDERLLAVCRLLHDELDAYDWVGFYMVDPNADRELVLGPYVGAPTDHTRIPFGTGICGQAAETLETFVIDDVTQQTNYLACSVYVKAEIVVPLMKGDVLLGELDIDSHKIAAFGQKDKVILEEVCEIISTMY